MLHSRMFALALADLDNDGNLDLVSANREGDNVGVLLGAGDGTFGTASNFAVGGAPTGVTVADFNADGELDIATANQEGSLTEQDDVSVLLAGVPTLIPTDGIPADLVDCGAGCGPAGVTPVLLTLLGLVGMRQSRRRIGLRP